MSNQPDTAVIPMAVLQRNVAPMLQAVRERVMLDLAPLRVVARDD